eukprot:2555054-Rhodomonas_salina.1
MPVQAQNGKHSAHLSTDELSSPYAAWPRVPKPAKRPATTASGDLLSGQERKSGTRNAPAAPQVREFVNRNGKRRVLVGQPESTRRAQRISKIMQELAADTQNECPDLGVAFPPIAPQRSSSSSNSSFSSPENEAACARQRRKRWGGMSGADDDMDASDSGYDGDDALPPSPEEERGGEASRSVPDRFSAFQQIVADVLFPSPTPHQPRYDDTVGARREDGERQRESENQREGEREFNTDQMESSLDGGREREGDAAAWRQPAEINIEPADISNLEMVEEEEEEEEEEDEEDGSGREEEEESGDLAYAGSHSDSNERDVSRERKQRERKTWDARGQAAERGERAQRGENA